MYNHILYLIYWLINSLFLFIFSVMIPQNLVLGTNKYTPIETAIYSGFWLTFFIWVIWDYLVAKKAALGKDLKTIGVFWGINTIGLVCVSLVGKPLGIQIQGLLFMVVVGFVINLIQRLIWNYVTQPKG